VKFFNCYPKYRENNVTAPDTSQSTWILHASKNDFIGIQSGIFLKELP
jgi:hypothetical protein